jgi:hypothetical protein
VSGASPAIAARTEATKIDPSIVDAAAHPDRHEREDERMHAEPAANAGAAAFRDEAGAELGLEGVPVADALAALEGALPQPAENEALAESRPADIDGSAQALDAVFH